MVPAQTGRGEAMSTLSEAPQVRISIVRPAFQPGHLAMGPLAMQQDFLCDDCEVPFRSFSGHAKRCEKCRADHHREQAREYARKKRKARKAA